MGANNMKYKIIDWAYNRMFPNKTFKTFDHAIAFLDERFSEDEMQDIFIVDIETRCYLNGYWSTMN
jgi:hypothetical protein